MIRPISLLSYMALVDDLDAENTIFLEGWPISVGVHRDLGRIALAHVGEGAWLITPPPTDLVAGVGPAA